MSQKRNAGRAMLAGVMTLLSATAFAQSKEPVADVFFVAHGVGTGCAPAMHGAVSPGSPGEHIASGNAVTGAPYSGVGTTETVQMLADGNRIVRKNTMRYFRDSKGRTRTEYVLSGVGPFTIDRVASLVRINDPVTNQRYVLHPERKLAMRLPNDIADFDFARAPVAGQTAISGVFSSAGTGNVNVGQPRNVITSAPMPLFGCTQSSGLPAQPVSLGERTISGIRAVGSRIEFRIAAGAIGNEQPITVRSEQWFSPELGVVLESAHLDPMVGETRYKLEQISRAEPDASLFKPPADYTIEEWLKPGEAKLQRGWAPAPAPSSGGGAVPLRPR